MSSKIITIKGSLGIADCVLLSLLPTPPERRAYAIEAISASSRNGIADAGVVIGIQDGEVEEALLDRATPAGPATTFVSGTALRDAELHVYGSIGLRGLGVDTNTHNFLPPYQTANPQHLILMSSDTGNTFLIHVQYSDIHLSTSEWAALKHRPNVVDRSLGTMA